MLTGIVGINWGDEGKGRMVDLLSEEYDIICRYQGGNNAGHTVKNEKGKFVLNLLPSGILRENVINVMGNGMVVDLEHLYNEIKGLRSKGVNISPVNLVISDKANICLPYHVDQDCLEEDRLEDKKFGSTRRGIAPVYSDKYMKRGIRIADLRNFDTLPQKLADIIEWKNILLSGYGDKEILLKEIMSWLKEFGEPILPYIKDTTSFLSSELEARKTIMFEAQLGALRDIEFGIYPYTTSSHTISSYATTGAGIPGEKLEKVIGVMKAYSSCVGEGPFVCELFGEEGNFLREAGEEYGAATGRPRRVGGFDVVASKYGVKIQGATEIALTKLDILSGYDKIPVCIGYKVGKEVLTDFPTDDRLQIAEPVYEYLEGFKEDISSCRKKEDLPKAAYDYIMYIEKAVGCHIKYVSVGAERDAYLLME